ncbi:MAG: TRAP transporter large permease [Proteobacteria bacterium]|nr:TRAP transporter large permease [Pseudomonadota bacterium]
MITAIVVAFFALGIIGMPLAFALGIASLLALLIGGLPITQIPGKMVHSIDSFPLMAIPLFMLAGQLMLRGGIMERLIDFANSVVGRVRGGLAHVTVVAAMGLSSVSGTAVADATALGGTLGPALIKSYSKGFGASVVASSSNLGPIIPPSAGMIVYAIMAEDVSIGGLFVAGILPGIVLGLAMMGLCTYIARRRGYPLTGEPLSLRGMWRQTRRSFIVFMMPVVVIGGIIAGVFTATEGAAIAVVYALVIGFFVTRRLKLSDLAPALLNAAVITGIVGALIAFASSVTYLFTVELLAQTLADFLKSVTTDPYQFTLLVMLILVVVGMFMEANASYVMLVPLIAPIAAAYGIDPIWFGFLFVMNVTLGGITPPVGILLFVVSGIWRISMTELVANIWPFILVQYAALFVCFLFPALVTLLPRALGY